ncbi:hypothetical protein T4B_615 [Trichinella pseudospiralis]|uniref:Uncharacterized protein n=2 Tax=Trichinella pseudospiralis TaxID=6337 RepID=A0A0V1IGI1_TRIPS|nr:hypothetical protein T4D_4982 [Trichinella pseudospiralis]KRY92029.1 hypothetical protein T4D_12258 [Trichinella pseudospiralis]KRZ21760.1 hypothetical protein T4B_4689 [Trichinella pseudospiralis]KRZ23982.1 hypothetical protein T4B_615 [Trichinella pseudospiralis]KRZ35207.1 hypothetical protein T4C_13420 [Trichinella pseudospiralis]
MTYFVRIMTTILEQNGAKRFTDKLSAVAVMQTLRILEKQFQLYRILISYSLLLLAQETFIALYYL